jgi:RimJ/RimL family protein N-acetyltransferase
MIRPMQLTDLLTIDAMENELQINPWPMEAFLQAIRLKQHCQVYEEDGVILGYSIADRGHGRTIATKSTKATGQLFRDWFDHVQAEGVQEMFVEIAPGNEASLARIKRFGFQKVGVRPSFYGPGKIGRAHV